MKLCVIALDHDGTIARGDVISPQVRETIAAARARRRLRLGSTDDGREFSLAVIGRNVLIAGDAASGKSWIAGALAEQLILHRYCVCVIDPEGDYRSLEALPGVVVLGGGGPLPPPREVLRTLRYPDRSLVLDLARVPHDEKLDYIRTLLPLLNELRRATGLPHRIVVDEAHYFLHDAAAHDLLDLEANGYTFVTYSASRLPTELLDATEVMIVTGESDPAEVEALRRRCPPVSAEEWERLPQLGSSQAVALPVTEESGGRLVQFTPGPRLTPHVRHRQKYVDVPVSDRKAFVFTATRQQERRIVRTLREFADELRSRDDCDGYLARGDFSRWVRDVFGDHALAAALRGIEAAHRASPAAGSVAAVVRAIVARYELAEPAGPTVGP